MTIKRFRNKPIYIEAVYFDGSEESYKECRDFAKGLLVERLKGSKILMVLEENKHVMCYCSAGCWLARNDKGLYFDIHSDLLSASYCEV